MENVSKTLYIPLYGKAYVSRKGILLKDPKAEQIWEKEGFPLKGKASSKWLAYYMGMRSAVFDNWVREMLRQSPDAVAVHIGCGMDSRAERIGTENSWYDVDFPEVIRERKKYYSESCSYRMLSSDAREKLWLEQIPEQGTAIVIMEGISMYFSPEELETLLKDIRSHFSRVHLLMDCYSTLAAKASKYKNPINSVGVTTVYGMDTPKVLAEKTGYRYEKAHSLTPLSMIGQLSASERVVFSNLYAGRLARKLYLLYEFQA